MNQADKVWLENRVLAAVDDDFYLDRDEEKRIKEEGSAKGIPIKDIELVVRAELDKVGAVWSTSSTASCTSSRTTTASWTPRRSATPSTRWSAPPPERRRVSTPAWPRNT